MGQQSLLNASAIAFAVRLFGLALGYVFSLVVARLYGAGVWGDFVIALMLVQVSGIIARLGQDTVITKYASEYHVTNRLENLSSLAARALLFVLPLSVGIGLLLLQLAGYIAHQWFGSETLSLPIETLALCIPILAVKAIVSQFVRAHGRVLRYSFLNDVSIYFAALLLLLIGHVSSFQLTVEAIYLYGSIGVLFFVFLVSIGSIFVSTSDNKVGPSKVVSLKMVDHLKLGIPLMMSSSMFFVMSWTDTFMLGALMSNDDVGHYNIAWRLASLATIFLAAINTLAGVRYAQYWASSDIASLRRTAQLTATALFILTLPASLLLIVGSHHILSLFGETFVAAEGALFILVCGQVVSASCGSVGMIMQMTNRQREFQTIVCFAAVVNIALNWILIPKYGIEGAALASALATVLWNILGIFILYRGDSIWVALNPFALLPVSR